MQEEITEQRILVEQIIALCERVRQLNKEIKDEEFHTDLQCIIGQHRHTFEEQGVTNHDECISYTCVTGSFGGVTGGMIFLCHVNDLFKASIIEVAKSVLL